MNALLDTISVNQQSLIKQFMCQSDILIIISLYVCKLRYISPLTQNKR